MVILNIRNDPRALLSFIFIIAGIAAYGWIVNIYAAMRWRILKTRSLPNSIFKSHGRIFRRPYVIYILDRYIIAFWIYLTTGKCLTSDFFISCLVFQFADFFRRAGFCIIELLEEPELLNMIPVMFDQTLNQLKTVGCTVNFRRVIIRCDTWISVIYSFRI